MLAYDPGVAIAYDIGLTELSLASAAIVITAVDWSCGLRAPLGRGARRRFRRRRRRLHALSRHVGVGIAWPYHTGRRPGRSLDRRRHAVGDGGAAPSRSGANEHCAIFLAALLLTLAIVSHHFTAMGAVEIVPDPTRVIAGSGVVADHARACGGERRHRDFGTEPGAAPSPTAGSATKACCWRSRSNNMTQGLVMFDRHGTAGRSATTAICEMYGLYAATVKPGMHLRRPDRIPHETGKP